MKQIFLFFSLLSFVVAHCSASKPIKLGSTISEEIGNAHYKQKKETIEATLRICLYQETPGIKISDLIGHAQCSVRITPEAIQGKINTIDIFEEDQRNKGYGSRLFKQAIAQLYCTFACDSITFTAYPFRDPYDLKALASLEKFYIKHGAIAGARETILADKENPESNQITYTPMIYPIHSAAILAAIMPIFEPTIATFSNNGITSTIIQYVGHADQYQKKESAATILSSNPLNNQGCGLTKLQ